MKVAVKGELTPGAAFDRITALLDDRPAQIREATEKIDRSLGERVERIRARVPEAQRERLDALLNSQQKPAEDAASF